MKSYYLIFIGFCLLFGCYSPKKQASNLAELYSFYDKTNPEKYAKTITQEELKTHLYTYASDEFEGRETGEKGQKKAVDYLKNEYKALGIPTPLGGDDYFQEVYLEKQRVAKAKVSINDSIFKPFESQIVLSVSKSINLSINEVIFIGHGVDSDNYSDYKDINVKDKVVVAKSGEAKDANGNYVSTGSSEPTKWSNGRQAISSKRDAAIAHGAKGFIYIDNALFSRYAPYYQRLSTSGQSGRLSLKSGDEDFFVLMGNQNFGEALYPQLLLEHASKVVNTKLNLNIKNNSEAIVSENVVAFIKGSEKPDEIIVLSAHLDHEGVKNGQVYNGADDDGSGTVAILEIAEAFKLAEKDGHGPKRSILFLHVTGEEKGLLGSRHYTDNDPIFPLENTVANLNIDMIGRTDPKREEGDRNYIYLIGSDKLSTELHNVSEVVNAKYCNIELDYTYNDDNDPNRFYYRSDHYNFAKHNIPVIFYFNGTHADYHQPSDTADKIEYDLLENRARLVFYTAWEVANRDKRLVVDKVFE